MSRCHLHQTRLVYRRGQPLLMSLLLMKPGFVHRLTNRQYQNHRLKRTCLPQLDSFHHRRRFRQKHHRLQTSLYRLNSQFRFR